MKIIKLGVLGAGQMGMGIAQIAASNGYTVILRDIKKEFCKSAVAKIKLGLDKRVSQSKETQGVVDKVLENIATTTDMRDLADCDLVIEAVPEVLELKRATFRELG